MHLQVRGACRPWLWKRRHDATSGARSATGPASTPRDRPTPGADYHISLQSRQAPPTAPTPPPANSFRRRHAEKSGSKQGLKSLNASVRSTVGPRTHHQDRIPAELRPSPSSATARDQEARPPALHDGGITQSPRPSPPSATPLNRHGRQPPHEPISTKRRAKHFLIITHRSCSPSGARLNAPTGVGAC